MSKAMRTFLIVCLMGAAAVVGTRPEAQAQQGTTTNLNIGTLSGARSAAGPQGPQGFTIKQRQIGKPKYDDVSANRKRR